MTNCCDIPNPLIRRGISQEQRQVPALPPDFVKVDEMDLADFLVFAYQLSKQIIYYKAKLPAIIENAQNLYSSKLGYNSFAKKFLRFPILLIF